MRTPAQQKKLNNYGWRVWEGRSRYKPSETVKHGRDARLADRRLQAREGPLRGHGRLRVPRQGRARRARALLLRRLLLGTTSGASRTSKGKLVGNRREQFHVVLLSSFGEDSAGELYLVSLHGRIYRLEP